MRDYNGSSQQDTRQAAQPAYTDVDRAALDRYLRQRVNPLIPDKGVSFTTALADLITHDWCRARVEQLSDAALCALFSVDVLATLDTLCGADVTRRRMALNAVIAHIEGHRLGGMYYDDARQTGCLIGIMDRATHPDTRALDAHGVLRAVSERVYERPVFYTPVMAETALMSLRAEERSDYSARIERVLRAVCVDLLAAQV